MTKVIVIGANHAGTACINTMLDTYRDLEVVVYDRNNNISFLGCGMALWIGKQIKGSDGLFYSKPSILEGKGAKIHMESEVKHIDFAKKTVTVALKDGQVIEDNYDKLVLATGSQPVTLNVPGHDLANIQLVKLFQNAGEVIDKLQDKKFKRIAVLGAGYIGVELAEAFRRLDKEVVLIDMAPHILGTYFDDEFNDKMQAILEKNGVQMALGEKVMAFEGNAAGEVCAVKTDKTKYDVDMVISCVGFKPNNALGKEHLQVFKNGAYLVNLKQQTSEKDVYAVGDCATVFDNSLRAPSYIALATNAVRSGIVAAHNIGGTPLESLGVQGSSGICIYDYKMLCTGINEKRATAEGIEVLSTSFSDLQKPAFMETENPMVDIKIVYRKDDRTVVGAQLASECDMSGILHLFSAAIYKRMTIEEIALLDIFFMPHFNQPYNYITMAAITAK